MQKINEQQFLKAYKKQILKIKTVTRKIQVINLDKMS